MIKYSEIIEKETKINIIKNNILTNASLAQKDYMLSYYKSNLYNMP
jgi:hypothetical protein